MEEKVERTQMKLRVSHLIIVLIGVTSVLVAFGGFLVVQQKEIIIIRNEVDILKSEIASLKFDHARNRREAESNPDSSVSDGVPVVYDYAYGIDLATKSSLSVYPSLQGDHRGRKGQVSGSQSSGSGASTTSNSGSGGGRSSSTNYNYHYLGVHRYLSSENTTTQQPPMVRIPLNSRNMSSYSKRLANTFRHSRVSQTEERPNSPGTTLTPTPTPGPPMEFKRPQVKSLDSESRNFPDLLSIHLQAKVSVGDESSSQLSTGLHDSWRLSSWSEKLRGAKAFDFEEDSGFVKVPETGLYFVYVQVEYMDSHDVNSYEVYLDNDPFISCVTSTHAPKEKKKHNTCYTAAVVFLQEGGSLRVRDKEAGRYSLLHSSGTFFGLTKLQ